MPKDYENSFDMHDGYGCVRPGIRAQDSNHQSACLLTNEQLCCGQQFWKVSHLATTGCANLICNAVHRCMNITIGILTYDALTMCLQM